MEEPLGEGCVMYVDTWHLHAPLRDGPYTWTMYGIKTKAEATIQANRMLDSGLVKYVDVVHTTKKTVRARWEKETTRIGG